MPKSVYVSNISFEATEEEIFKLFSVVGKVSSIHLINDPATGKFSGTCFVKMASAEAREVIDTLDGAHLGVRPISVTEARPYKGKGGGPAAENEPARPTRPARKGPGKRRK